MTGGWIKTERSMIDHPTLQSDMAFRLWSVLLARASYRPTRINWKGQTIHLEPGQLAVSIRSLGREFGWSHKAVRHAISRWNREAMLSETPIWGTVSGAGKGTVGTLITICNWLKYQVQETNEGTVFDIGAGTVGAQQGHSRGTQNKKVRKKEGTLSLVQTPNPNSESESLTLRSVVENPDKNAVERALRIWKEELPDNPQPRKIEGGRRASLLARLRGDFRGSPAQWRAYCKKIAESPCLVGGGRDGWYAPIDWAIKPANLNKVLDGNYEQRTPNGRWRDPRSVSSAEILADAVAAEEEGNLDEHRTDDPWHEDWGCDRRASDALVARDIEDT